MTRKPSKAAQKRAAEFNAGVVAYVESLGAVFIERMGGHVLATPLGPLFIHPQNDWIHARFTCAKAAAPSTGCSVPSGKWNLHAYQDGKPAPQESLRWFRDALARVLAWEPSAEERRLVTEELEADFQSSARWIACMVERMAG